MDKLVLDIIALGYAIDQETDYCVFVRWSGHVKSLDVSICESKEKYNTRLCEFTFYTDHGFDGDKERLVEIHARLKKVLEDKNLDSLVSSTETKKVATEFKEVTFKKYAL